MAFSKCVWAVLSTAVAINQGPLLIDVDGETVTTYVVAQTPKGEKFQPNGRDLFLRHAGEMRGFLAVKETDDMPADNYFNFTFFNKEISYDLDMSNVGCSCNVALFFTSMPGHNPDGSIAHGDLTPYYCDATKVGGVLCWEHDTIEANKYAVATTPHQCDADPDKYVTYCHQRGCQSNTFLKDPKSLCPDSSCKIDTRKPFHIAQRFEGDASGAYLAKITNVFTQGNNTFEWDVCGKPEYVASMTPMFKANSTMVFQLWGTTWDTMDWLDAPTHCTGDCDIDTTTAIMSNIAVKTLVPKTELVVV